MALTCLVVVYIVFGWSCSYRILKDCELYYNGDFYLFSIAMSWTQARKSSKYVSPWKVNCWSFWSQDCPCLVWLLDVVVDQVDADGMLFYGVWVITSMVFLSLSNGLKVASVLLQVDTFSAHEGHSPFPHSCRFTSLWLMPTIPHSEQCVKHVVSFSGDLPSLPLLIFCHVIEFKRGAVKFASTSLTTWYCGWIFVKQSRHSRVGDSLLRSRYLARHETLYSPTNGCLNPNHIPLRGLANHNSTPITGSNR